METSVGLSNLLQKILHEALAFAGAVGQTPTTESALRRQTCAGQAVTILRMDKLKVLICDDSAAVRDRLVTMALDLPEIAVVGQAQDVPGSLDAVRRTRPDVVILDIRMPGGNGIQVLREVKKMDSAPRVIMFTTYVYPPYRQKCEQAGADFFLDKSTEFDRLLDVLEQVRQGLRAEAGLPGE